MSISDDLLDALGRVPGEREAAFRALCDYAGGGREEGAKRARSIRGLAERYQAAEDAPTKRYTTLRKWAEQFRWAERVAAFDQAVEKARLERWVERRLDVDEEDWSDGERLRKLGRRMVREIEAQLDRGETVGAGAAGKALETASKLQRAASGAPQDATDREMSGFVQMLRKVYSDDGDGGAGGDGAVFADGAPGRAAGRSGI